MFKGSENAAPVPQCWPLFPSVCLMQQVLPGLPSSILAPLYQCLYCSLPFRSVSDFPIVLKNKIKFGFTFLLYDLTPVCLSYCIFCHPPPHPENSGPLASSLFSNPPYSFLIQSCGIPLFHVTLLISFLALTTIQNHLILYVVFIYVFKKLPNKQILSLENL